MFPVSEVVVAGKPLPTTGVLSLRFTSYWHKGPDLSVVYACLKRLR